MGKKVNRLRKALSNLSCLLCVVGVKHEKEDAYVTEGASEGSDTALKTVYINILEKHAGFDTDVLYVPEEYETTRSISSKRSYSGLRKYGHIDINDAGFDTDAVYVPEKLISTKSFSSMDSSKKSSKNSHNALSRNELAKDAGLDTDTLFVPGKSPSTFSYSTKGRSTRSCNVSPTDVTKLRLTTQDFLQETPSHGSPHDIKISPAFDDEEELHEPEWTEILQYELHQNSIPESIFCGGIDVQHESPESVIIADGIPWQQQCDKAGTYFGPLIHGNVPEGNGYLEFENGDTYTGPFKNGYMHGQKGVYKWYSGSVYVGGFEENLRHGHGQHSVGGRIRYVGQFVRGIPHGYGEGYNADGSVFHKGQWETGMPAHRMIVLSQPSSPLHEETMASGILACDVSLESSLALPERMSRYDPYRRIFDDHSMSSDDDSLFSELTTSVALLSEIEYDGDDDWSCVFENDDNNQVKSSKYVVEGSFLTLGPLTPLHAERLRNSYITEEHNLLYSRPLQSRKKSNSNGLDDLSNLYGPRMVI